MLNPTRPGTCWCAVLVCLVITAVFVSFLPGLTMDNSNKSFFKQGDTSRELLERFQDSPVLVGMDESQVELGYCISNVFGLAVQSAMHQSTWRWELNYSPDFAVNFNDRLGRSLRVKSLLGWDYRFDNGVGLNLQGYGQYLEAAPASSQYRDYGLSCALAKDDFMGGDLALSYGMVWQISDASWFHQLAATWYVNDHVQWDASLNVFTGSNESLYGQYDEQSLFMLTFKYEF